jgi:hypothetical protein
MEKALKVINELKKNGLIDDYAVGGGIAAIFYIEPVLTYDLDLFIILHKKANGKKLIELSPIFEYLKHKGYIWKGEHIIIEGIPVQFIPADNLEQEAVKNANETIYHGIKTKVLTPEYLIAILLRAGRQKDIDKINKMTTQAKIQKKLLKAILEKYNLAEKYHTLIGSHDE